MIGYSGGRSGLSVNIRKLLLEEDKPLERAKKFLRKHARRIEDAQRAWEAVRRRPVADAAFLSGMLPTSRGHHSAALDTASVTTATTDDVVDDLSMSDLTAGRRIAAGIRGKLCMRTRAGTPLCATRMLLPAIQCSGLAGCRR